MSVPKQFKWRINPRTGPRTGPRTDPLTSQETSSEIDASGKVVLDHIYDQPDPRAYFSALQPHDYAIPKYASSYFTAIGRYLSRLRDKNHVGIVDVGSSYGVNGALLKLGINYDALVDSYTSTAVRDMSRAELIERDRALFQGDLRDRPHITGVDISRQALQFALDAGFIDDAIDTNLETKNLSADDRNCLADMDLVMSTGCIGYTSATTICRLTDGIIESNKNSSRNARPWSAHFVLRMYSYDRIADELAQRGYETYSLPGFFPQRKFISAIEQRSVLDKLRDKGVDPHGLEADGALYAKLFLSLPREDVQGARLLIRQLEALASA